MHFFVCCVLNIISFKNKIGGTSLDVSPACRYHSPPTLLLNVPGQTAELWETKKNKILNIIILIKISFNSWIPYLTNRGFPNKTYFEAIILV